MNTESAGVFEDVVRPVLAELVGTTLFVCVGVMSVAGVHESGPIAPALAQGLIIALLITAFGDISGGHFNPAVTMGAWMGGAISFGKGVLYVIVQLIGGLAGAGLSRILLPTTLFKEISGGAFILNGEVKVGEGILCEGVLTTVLVLTAMVTAMDPVTKSSLAPLAVGFAVIVDILAGVYVTGACMNPARSLGPAVAFSTYNSHVWTYHYVYWVGPALGALLAGILYRLLFASQEKRLVFKSE